MLHAFFVRPHSCSKCSRYTLCLHIGRAVNTAFWVLWDLGIEAFLNLLQNILVGFVADKRDRKTLGTESTRTTNTMEVGVSIGWQVVVDSKVDSFNIDTSTEDVGGDTDSLVELLEFLVTFDTAT